MDKRNWPKTQLWIISVIMVTSLAAAGFSHFYHIPGVDSPQGGLTEESLAIKTHDGKTHDFTVEIAATSSAKEIGLMFRKQMDENHGMLFEMGHPARETSFWMKNTFIPLDMLFVGRYGDIVNIRKNAVPQSLDQIGSVYPVVAVIELDGGLADKLGIKVGDSVVHPYFETPASAH